MMLEKKCIVVNFDCIDLFSVKNNINDKCNLSPKKTKGRLLQKIVIQTPQYFSWVFEPVLQAFK